MNNTGLAEHAKMALSQNWGYCLGAFGNILTEAFLAQKCSQGGGVGEYNTNNLTYLRKFINNYVTDCYGLVKSYIWWSNGTVKYNPAQDRNQESAFSAASEKGTIDTIPEIEGLVLWMKGHAGIYIGQGEFIECAGAPIGMKKGKIQNGKVISGSKFTHWFKDNFITYPDVDLKNTVAVDFKGKKYNLQAENVEGTYIATIKDLSQLSPDLKISVRNTFESNGFTVSWDDQTKTIVIS